MSFTKIVLFFLEIWREEDEEENDEEALEDKQELIRGFYLLGDFKEQAKDFAMRFKDTVKEEV